MLTKLSLFSGIGGDDLASDWAGIQTIAFCERDKYCRQVISKHWPGIPIYGDVKDVGADAFKLPSRSAQGKKNNTLRADCEQHDRDSMGHDAGNLCGTTQRIDIISGGFPCQPHSVAGKRKGSSDERNLWPEVRRILQEIKPRWFVGENVPGLFSSDNGDFFGGILSDLAALGYSVGWCCYGALDVGALHRRDRVFIVAHAASCDGGQPIVEQARRERAIPETDGERFRNQFAGCGIALAYSSIKGLEGAEPASGAAPTGRQPEQCGDVMAHAESEQNQSVESSLFAGGLPRQSGRSSSEGATESTGQLESRVGLLADDVSAWMARLDRDGWFYTEPDIPRVATGVKDRVNKLRALGNAVCPAQIYPIYKAIVEIEANR